MTLIEAQPIVLKHARVPGGTINVAILTSMEIMPPDSVGRPALSWSSLQ